jgi:hypothetical protein
LQQAKDNSKHLSNLSVNAAKTFEQNSKEIGTAVKDATNSNFDTANNNNNNNKTTTSTTTKQ